MAQAPIPGLAAALPGTPIIQFNSTNHDFGRVMEGRVVETEFTFINAGDVPLEIREVRPDCGCTATTNWDHRIEPGQSGVIPVQFKSAGFLGSLAKSVAVFSNDPARSNVVLKLTAQVWKPINVIPALVYFSLTSETQTNETRVVKITNNDPDEVLTLSPPTSDQRLFRATVKTNQAGQGYELEIGLVPPISGSNTTGTITIPTSSSKVPVLNVSAVAVLQPPVTAVPPQLLLPPGPLDVRYELSVYIRNHENAPFVASNASVSLTNVQVQLDEFQKGRLFRALLHFPAGFQLPPAGQGELTVQTSHPRVPVLKVPILARPPAATRVPSSGAQ